MGNSSSGLQTNVYSRRGPGDGSSPTYPANTDFVNSVTRTAQARETVRVALSEEALSELDELSLTRQALSRRIFDEVAAGARENVQNTNVGSFAHHDSEDNSNNNDRRGHVGRRNQPNSAIFNLNRRRSREASRESNFRSTNSTLYGCRIKSKPIKNEVSRASRRVAWFEIQPDTCFKIGSGAHCEFRLENDDHCAEENAKLVTLSFNPPEAPVVLLKPQARIYRLVGMGSKRISHATLLYPGAVIKVGSISLEVTSLCTEESVDYFRKISMQYSRRRNNSRVDSASTSSNDSSNSTSDLSRCKNESHDRTDLNEDELDTQNREESNDTIGTRQHEPICYICWNGEETNEDSDKENAMSSTSDSGKNYDAKIDPLIESPCGKCSGTSRYVHLGCLLTWIKTSRSVYCSICNGELPSQFSSSPPKIELKVIRHRRGQSWVGQRRFSASFCENEIVTIGRLPGADIRLLDLSVGNIHAQIVFNRITRQFILIDCDSCGGTFLQIKTPIMLSPDSPVYLKVGRSLLSIWLTQRQRQGFLLKPALSGLSWIKR